MLWIWPHSQSWDIFPERLNHFLIVQREILKNGGFHLKLYSLFQDLSWCSIWTGFRWFRDALKFFKLGLREQVVVPKRSGLFFFQKWMNDMFFFVLGVNRIILNYFSIIMTFRFQHGQYLSRWKGTFEHFVIGGLIKLRVQSF